MIAYNDNPAIESEHQQRADNWALREFLHSQLLTSWQRNNGPFMEVTYYNPKNDTRVHVLSLNYQPVAFY